MHLLGLQLVRDHAHLFVDIVPSSAFGEGRELFFNILGMLVPQRRSSELLGAGPVTSGAGGNAALGVAGEDQADRGVRLSETPPALRDAFTGYWIQPSATMGEISRHIGRVLIARGGRDRA